MLLLGPLPALIVVGAARADGPTQIIGSWAPKAADCATNKQRTFRAGGVYVTYESIGDWKIVARRWLHVRYQYREAGRTAAFDPKIPFAKFRVFLRRVTKAEMIVERDDGDRTRWVRCGRP